MDSMEVAVAINNLARAVDRRDAAVADGLRLVAEAIERLAASTEQDTRHRVLHPGPHPGPFGR